MTMSKPRFHRQAGSSLLEVMVAIMVMAFGLLGLAGMTASSLQYSKMAQFQTIGTQLASSYGDRMRSNVTGFMANNYDMTTAYSSTATAATVPACGTPAKCTPAEMAAIDKAEWQNELLRRLPAGGAYVTRDVSGNTLAADIWVMWADPNMGTGSDNLSASTTGGNACPAAALSGIAAGTQAPKCLYYRVVL